MIVQGLIASLRSARAIGVFLGVVGILLALEAFGRAPQAGYQRLSDDSLELIRGLNPDFVKYRGGNCLSQNLYTETVFDPPGSRPSVVGIFNCDDREGVMCISCGGTFDWTKHWLMGEGAEGAAIDYLSPSIAVLCNEHGGLRGVCESTSANPRIICSFRGSYECTTVVVDFVDQE